MSALGGQIERTRIATYQSPFTDIHHKVGTDEAFVRNGFVLQTTHSQCLDPNKSIRHDGQMEVHEAGKCIRE